MAQKKIISEQTKEILSYISKEKFCKFADRIEDISTDLLFVDSNVGKQKEIDYLEAACIICEFSEEFAAILTKVNKKFAGFAKVLKEEKNKLEGP